LVEHSLGKGEVTSSILVIGSIWLVKGHGFSRAGKEARKRAALAAEVWLRAGGRKLTAWLERE
jgi:hypothetical protein